jgi:competence protein ComEC
MPALEFLSAAPAAVWQQHAPPAWTLAAAVLGALLVLAPRGTPARAAGAAAFLPLFFTMPPSPTHGAFSLAVLDVGQGLALVVRTQNHSLLYDAGPEFVSDSDAGERIVMPFLRGEGIPSLTALIVSHDDSDHSGGADSVLQGIPVRWFASSLANSHPVAAQVENKVQCQAGQSWTWDGVRFDVLHPTVESYDNFALKDNARSCVIKITSRSGSALLTADIEEKQERELMARSDRALTADVLIAPHHGAKSSSSQAFVRAVNPAIVVFSSGYRNRFGHPRAEVVARYQAIGSEILRTDNDGALLLDFSSSVSLRRWRLASPRYWHASH